jgi:hypothetical protein
MAKRITQLKVHEASLVDGPACPGAAVLLWKRDTGSAAREARMAIMRTAVNQLGLPPRRSP